MQVVLRLLHKTSEIYVMHIAYHVTVNCVLHSSEMDSRATWPSPRGRHAPHLQQPHRGSGDAETPVHRKGEGCSTEKSKLPASDIGVHRIKARRAYCTKRPIYEDLNGTGDEAVAFHPVDNPQITVCTP